MLAFAALSLMRILRPTPELSEKLRKIVGTMVKCMKK